MNKNLLRIRYIAFDALAAVIVWLLFTAFRRVVNDALIFEGIYIFIPNYNYYSTLIVFPALCIAISYLSGYYVDVIKRSPFLEFVTTLVSSAVISIIIFFVLLLDDVVVDYTFYYKSLLVLFSLLFVVTFAFRIVLSANIRRYFRQGKWAIHTLIIGTGKNARSIAGEITRNSYFNRVVGFVATDPDGQAVDEERVVGHLNDMGKQIEQLHVNEVIVALDDASEQRIFEIINRLFRYDIDIQFTPRLYEILTGKVRLNNYGLSPLVSITHIPMDDWQLCVKRMSDIVLSVFSLALLSPLIVYFAIAIKLDSKGSAIFKQERIGRYGKTFNMYKFRTMRHNAENGQPKLSTPDDTRITKMGRVLRKYRFDEIPQFVNIIKGDMSIVGPRPERKYFVDKIILQAPYYCLLYRIRPGLTSWGPIKIGYSDTIEKMIERLNYDIVYMENMSLFTDLSIVASTLEIIFKGKGV